MYNDIISSYSYNMSNFNSIPLDYSWSFSDKTIKDTAYITHNYYTYPAKFIPQLVSRLINIYTKEMQTVADPFMGSGTAIVEAIVNKRYAYGTDINEIAYLISKVKSTPLNIELLKKEYSILEEKLTTEKEEFLIKAKNILPDNERIDYWFKPKQKEELSLIFYFILEIENTDIRDFYLVAFAQILKTASIWLQKSIKPTRDMKKKEYNSYSLFFSIAKRMIKRHELYNSMLDKNFFYNINKYRKIKCGDSRFMPLEDGEADFIVTSPPYVTSYEYADLHQLPSLWFGYLNTLSEFREKFIGSSYKNRDDIDNMDLKSDMILQTINNFSSNKKKIREIKNYYADMLESFIEMKRILKVKGKAAIVIGNTQFKNIDILNAEIFCEQMTNIGFRVFDIIHREIPSKMLPSTRDSSTGRFAKISSTDKLVYPTEYILIMEKV
ncbi:DNA methyltransferase [uncultured Brachyspira sp.]|uniref:DNA methyltransferase n=1 Tax=uncultured Brachyspira sp. TaxID=221953 RepID=UPI0025DFF83D|nr:DNA methyltransferase [uncultured Brachyspira sp.]